MSKDRTDVAFSIAEDLLEQDALNLDNFADDADALLNFVQEIVLEHLKDYLIVSGYLL